jgi:glycerol-3-phosphate dehydrogenase subunit B
MKFDVILIGGGLSSLVCGIRLQKAGRRCLMVSAGQNALHFSSGAFGLLGSLPDGTAVQYPLEAIPSLPAGHPYAKIGVGKIAEYAAMAPGFFESCGVHLVAAAPAAADPGAPDAAGVAVPASAGPGAAAAAADPVLRSVRNGYRFTATGTMKPAWLAMSEVAFFPTEEALRDSDGAPVESALIVNFAGFLDFNARVIAEGLEKNGIRCRLETVRIDDVERLRKNPSEMRSVNIARVMTREQNWKGFAHQVKELMKGEDMVVLPEVFGLGGELIPQWLSEMIPAKVTYVGTMPPSVCGIRTQMRLKEAFESAGGTFLLGDEVLDPEVEDGRVLCVRTSNLGSMRLVADSYVLASGNLFGNGLTAAPGEFREPVFGLDVDYPQDRSDWYDPDFFAKQNYIGVGVKTDGAFHPYIAGRVVENLYVAGSEVGGCNSLAEGSGAGVAIMTAFKVADGILGRQEPANA